MTTFFSILFILLAVNAVLLIFSVNQTGEKSRKPVVKISDAQIISSSPSEHSETKYKKAV